MGFSDQVFSWPIRVYYEDTDAGGIVFYANYLKFYERARTELLTALSIEQDDLLKQQIAFVVKRVVVDNMTPARFNDRLVVKTKIKELKKASVIFTQWIELHDQVINQAEIQIASVDLAKMKPVRIPAFIYEELQSVS